MKEKDSEEVKL